MKHLIKKTLLEYIMGMYDSKEVFSLDVYNYKGKGKQCFYDEIEKAVSVLAGLSMYELVELYENLRDPVPVKRGVKLNRRVKGHISDVTLEYLYAALGTTKEPPGFVYNWAIEVLQNPYYTDLFSQFITFPGGAVNKEGCLEKMKFTVEVSECLFISDYLELLPMRTERIYIVLSDGEELSLFENNHFDKSIKPFDKLEDLLDSICRMDEILPLAF